MSVIRVVDARMGRGKTSAAVAYMSENEGKKRFLYITPFLTEVDRICEACDFEQPDGDNASKLCNLKAMMSQRINVAATHSLFQLLDDDALELVRRYKYCLIVDESVDVIKRINITSRDREILLSMLTEVDEDGRLHWIDQQYDGKFIQYKELVNTGSLFVLDDAIISIMNPELLSSFQEVIMMTYLFNGQYQRAYLDYFGFQYQLCGISTDGGFRFTDEPDIPPPLDYSALIQIVDDQKLNAIGEAKYSLSKNWYKHRKRDHQDIKILRNNLNTFFRRRTISKSNEQLWTCYKSDADKLYGQNNRFAGSFLQLAAKATNAYKSRKCLAYLINRYIDPNIEKFFARKDIVIDEDAFALSEMLQWIWRSCIRDDQPIELYIPSRRMRELLRNWIETTSKGDN